MIKDLPINMHVDMNSLHRVEGQERWPLWVIHGRHLCHMDAKDPSNFAKILAESPLYGETMSQKIELK